MKHVNKVQKDVGHCCNLPVMSVQSFGTTEERYGEVTQSYLVKSKYGIICFIHKLKWTQNFRFYNISTLDPTITLDATSDVGACFDVRFISSYLECAHVD